MADRNSWVDDKEDGVIKLLSDLIWIQRASNISWMKVNFSFGRKTSSQSDIHPAATSGCPAATCLQSSQLCVRACVRACVHVCVLSNSVGVSSLIAVPLLFSDQWKPVLSSLYLLLSLFLSRCFSLSISLSLSLTCTHTHLISDMPLSVSRAPCQYLSISLNSLVLVCTLCCFISTSISPLPSSHPVHALISTSSLPLALSPSQSALNFLKFLSISFLGGNCSSPPSSQTGSLSKVSGVFFCVLLRSHHRTSTV